MAPLIVAELSEEEEWYEPHPRFVLGRGAVEERELLLVLHPQERDQDEAQPTVAAPATVHPQEEQEHQVNLL